jgi:hypothetical protein
MHFLLATAFLTPQVLNHGSSGVWLGGAMDGFAYVLFHAFMLGL